MPISRLYGLGWHIEWHPRQHEHGGGLGQAQQAAQRVAPNVDYCQKFSVTG